MPQENVAQTKTLEALTVAGVALLHTYRGYNKDIETYTAQAGNKTYSLYRKNNESTWHCDWTASYNCQPIDLGVDASNKDAMLNAFASLLKSLQHSGGH